MLCIRKIIDKTDFTGTVGALRCNWSRCWCASVNGKTELTGTAGAAVVDYDVGALSYTIDQINRDCWCFFSVIYYHVGGLLYMTD